MHFPNVKTSNLRSSLFHIPIVAVHVEPSSAAAENDLCIKAHGTVLKPARKGADSYRPSPQTGTGSRSCHCNILNGATRFDWVETGLTRNSARLFYSGQDDNRVAVGGWLRVLKTGLKSYLSLGNKATKLQITCGLFHAATLFQLRNANWKSIRSYLASKASKNRIDSL